MKTKLPLSFKALAEYFGVEPDAIDIEIMAQLVGAIIVFPDHRAWTIQYIRETEFRKNYEFIGVITYDTCPINYQLGRRTNRDSSDAYVLI